MTPTENTDAGFTLLETLVAFVILALVLAGAIQSVSASVEAFSKARQARQVDQLINQMMVEVLASGNREPRAGSSNSGLSWKLESKILESTIGPHRLNALRINLSIRDARIDKTLRVVTTYMTVTSP